MDVVNIVRLVFVGYKGIRQWPKNLCTSQMKIPKITPPPLLCRLQYWLRLITQFNEPTNKNKNKVSKEFSKFWGLV